MACPPTPLLHVITPVVSFASTFQVSDAASVRSVAAEASSSTLQANLTELSKLITMEALSGAADRHSLGVVSLANDLLLEAQDNINRLKKELATCVNRFMAPRAHIATFHIPDEGLCNLLNDSLEKQESRELWRPTLPHCHDVPPSLLPLKSSLRRH